MYNRKDFLLEALDSIAAQDYPEYETIVMDDGSEDGTEAAVEEWLSGTTRAVRTTFRYIRLPHTGMPGLVRNRGAREASGQYIAFLDSDDLWKPHKLSNQVSFMTARPELAVSHTREFWIRSGREISQKGQKHGRDGFIFHDALKKCIIGPSTVMMPLKVFLDSGGFREDLEIAEDYELWLRLTSRFPVGYLDVPLTVKRAGHPGQLSEKYGHIEFFRIEALKNLVDTDFFPPDLRDAARAELSGKCGVYAAGCLKRGKTEEWERYTRLSGTYSRY